MAAAPTCATCGTEPSRADARFCDACGAAITPAGWSAEYKQVTVLFADVAHSMDIAAAVGAERLREIMTELLTRSADVVRRYGGTVDKFTGDGLMAVFGAPVALEDHAVRACLAALGIQEVASQLAPQVGDRDGVEFGLRVGLNSGQVIAGDIGSKAFGYTTIGEQVGMAQRMESVAPTGGVMLSDSTAGLVEHTAVLTEPETVHIKGVAAPVTARRLVAVAEQHGELEASDTTLVGRQWETDTIAAILDRAVNGRGCVVGVSGPAGIGKSRLVRETVAKARRLGVDVFSTFCESHATDVSFRVAARLLRDVAGIAELTPEAARGRVRAQVADADSDDLLLLDDLLGIRDPDVALPTIEPHARRRRLTALINSVQLARTEPVVHIIEDAHWIDEVSESMLAEFLAVIPRTPSMVLITYRPHYRGALAQQPGAQTISLASLSEAEMTALLGELLGGDPSVGDIRTLIAGRAAGNPFFAQEMVRELAQRGVLEGDRRRYSSRADVDQLTVPATLQATIAARIDHLEPQAKQTLNGAAVIGLRFTPELLAALGIDPILGELARAELIDQVRFTPYAEYAFRHPLIRMVAYESQLKSARADLHQMLAVAIEADAAAAVDEKAALIAEHLEAAGDLHGGYAWHMRAAGWSANRDIGAARLSWQRAHRVADQMPADDSDRAAMRIEPRRLLCATAWLSGGSVSEAGFDELRDLCDEAGDKVSLAIGIAGLLMALSVHGRYREAIPLASELSALVESIGDPELIVGLLFSAAYCHGEIGEAAEQLRLMQRVIDLADGDAAKGNLIAGSPLALAYALRGYARLCLGMNGWRADGDTAVAVAAPYDSTSRVAAVMWKYLLAIPIGALPVNAVVLRETADALEIAEQFGDNFTLALARLARGLALVHTDGPDRSEGFDLLAQVREAGLSERFTIVAPLLVDPMLAREAARTGDLDGAIERMRAVVDDSFAVGQMPFRGLAVTVLVESLIERRSDGDLQEAEEAVDRLAAVETEPGYLPVKASLLQLRAKLARIRGDANACQYFSDCYDEAVTSCGFEN
jgi:adenylate cyclase